VDERLHLVKRHTLASATAQQAPRAAEHGVAEAELDEDRSRRVR
jgi:hypothetical protein